MALRIRHLLAAALVSTTLVLPPDFITPAHAQANPPKQAAAAAPDPLLQQVEVAIDVSSRRHLDARAHTPWQIIHGVLAYRRDFTLMDGGRKINAIDFLSGGAKYQGTPWFEATEWGGRGQPFTKPYLFEGHPNQFLGYLALSDLPLGHKIETATRPITMADIIRNAQKTLQAGDEPSWTLWGLVHYVGPDATWENQHGESWSIERLVRSQVYEPVHRAACGGTHGLFALAYARNRYLESGQPLRGVWLEADQKVKRYTEEARALQNRDGSFSTRFFQGRGESRDPVTRLGPSGHTLEFLMMALPKERLSEQWVRSGIASVARDLIECRSAPIDCGPLYHAVSGVVIFRERTLGKQSVKAPADLADAPAVVPATSELKAPEPESKAPATESKAPAPELKAPAPEGNGAGPEVKASSTERNAPATASKPNDDERDEE